MKCPKCQRRLKVEATNCLCGWGTSFSQADKPAVQCFSAGCVYPARMRINGKLTCVVHHDEALRPAMEPV